MKKRTIILSLAISAACLLASAVPAFAAKSFTVEDAREIAAPYIPAGSTFLRSETDSREYELKYYNESLQELYELEVSRITGKVTKLDSQKIGYQGALEVALTDGDIEKMVKKQYPKAADISIRLDEDDGYYVYEVSLASGNQRIRLDIHPQTGVILETDIDYEYIDPDTSAQASVQLIGYEEAQNLALRHVPDATVTDIELEEESGTLIYEIELYKDGYEYDLILDALTGDKIDLSSHRDLWDDDDFFHWDHHGSSHYTGSHHGRHHHSSSVSAISVEQAKKLLLDKVPGARIKELELDTADGRLIYEGELCKGNAEYEFEMDACTGRFLKWEQD